MSTDDKKESQLSMVQLGDGGPMVSTLCLGTMTWGSQMTDEVKAQEMLDAFTAAGGNFIDTAEMYPVPCAAEWVGRTEEYIGRWLAKRGDAFRSQVVIATKVAGPCPRQFITENRGGPSKNTQLDPVSIREACEASLKRLKTSYVDILYLHWPSRATGLFGTSLYKGDFKDKHPFFPDLDKYEAVSLQASMLALKELIDAGKVKHWAISNENSFGVCSIVQLCATLGMPKPVCIQNDFSLVDRRFQSEVAEACAPWNHNISGVPYGILAGGTLSGKYLNGQAPAESRHVWNPSFQARYHGASTMRACAKYVTIAKGLQLAPAVLAMAWARQQFFNQSVIIGTNNMGQLHQCLQSARVTLDQGTLDAIDAIHFEDKNPNVSQ